MGGRGQERLLGSSVSLHGGGDAALHCGGFLAAAGVGRLAVPAKLQTTRPALLGRNPDCRIVDALEGKPDADVWTGELPERFPDATTCTLWGSARGEEIVRVRFPGGRACAACLRRAVTTDANDARGLPAQILGTLLAVDALRALLGLPSDRSDILRMDIARATCSTSPFPSLPGCRCCGS